MADADGKMRIEKCGWKKKARITKTLRKKKREMRITKKKKRINKQTNNYGKKSFFQVAVTLLDPSLHLHPERDANSWHSFVLSNSFH